MPIRTSKSAHIERLLTHNLKSTQTIHATTIPTVVPRNDITSTNLSMLSHANKWTRCKEIGFVEFCKLRTNDHGEENSTNCRRPLSLSEEKNQSKWPIWCPVNKSSMMPHTGRVLLKRHIAWRHSITIVEQGSPVHSTRSAQDSYTYHLVHITKARKTRDMQQ